MDRLETLIREVLVEHAADAPDVDTLVTPRRSRRAAWLTVAACVAASVAIVLTAVALTLTRDRSDNAPTPGRPASAHPRPTATHPATPPGLKRIAYRGITVAVPARLPVLTVPCSLPAEYVLASDPERGYSCPAQRRPPGLVFAVQLSSGPAENPPVGRGPHGQRHIGDVEITVTAPTQAQVAAVLRSAVIGQDPLGCPQTRPAKPTTPPAASLVPGHPVRGVYCLYASAGWLQNSHQLPSARLPRFVAQIDALPHGTAGTGTAWERDDVRFDYANGSSRTLSVTFDDPSVFSDGNLTSLDKGSGVALELQGG